MDVHNDSFHTLSETPSTCSHRLLISPKTNRDAKQQFSRLGDRAIDYIADGPTRKKTVLTRFSETTVTKENRVCGSKKYPRGF